MVWSTLVLIFTLYQTFATVGVKQNLVTTIWVTSSNRLNGQNETITVCFVSYSAIRSIFSPAFHKQSDTVKRNATSRNGTNISDSLFNGKVHFDDDDESTLDILMIIGAFVDERTELRNQNDSNVSIEAIVSWMSSLQRFMLRFLVILPFFRLTQPMKAQLTKNAKLVATKHTSSTKTNESFDQVVSLNIAKALKEIRRTIVEADVYDDSKCKETTKSVQHSIYLMPLPKQLVFGIEKPVLSKKHF